jgi:NTP pyrophosphatase (non-canonical NTP hydrolase)
MSSEEEVDAINLWCEWLADNAVVLVNSEMLRAANKHGWWNTPAGGNFSAEKNFIILSEEVGEVARALTYDEGSLEDLKAELLQVATMSLAFLYSLRDEPEEIPGQGLWQFNPPVLTEANSYLKTKTNHLEPGNE